MTEPEPVTVAACQIDVHLGRHDYAPVRAAVRDAAGLGARLIVLPELAVSGYVFISREEARAAAEPLDGPLVRMLCELTAELGCVVVCGLAERAADDELYVSAVVVDAGELRHTYRKAHLWGEEPRFFEAGRERPTAVATSAGRLAVMICYDLEFPEWVRLAAEAGAEIIAAPSNWPVVHVGHRHEPIEVAKARAVSAFYGVHVVVADRCGAERGVQWIGGSLICESHGALVAGPACAEQPVAGPVILTATLDLEAARDKRLSPHNHVLSDRRPELY